MKRVTWQLDNEVYDYLKEQSEKTGLSVQQTANIILKLYKLVIIIAPVEEKRKRGKPEFVKVYKCNKCGNKQPQHTACNSCGAPVWEMQHGLKKGGQ